jgi:hypothetical protein
MNLKYFLKSSRLPLTENFLTFRKKEFVIWWLNGCDSSTNQEDNSLHSSSNEVSVPPPHPPPPPNPS